MSTTSTSRDPVGRAEIAARCGVRIGTIDRWRQRHPAGSPHPFPDPRWSVSGSPAWNWPDIARWLNATGRTPTTD